MPKDLHTPAITLDFSEFDSKFLGVKTAKISLSKIDSLQLGLIRIAAKQGGYPLVLIKDFAFDYRLASTLEWSKNSDKLELADIKVRTIAKPSSISLPLNECPPGYSFVVTDEKRHKDDLIEITDSIAIRSRFSIYFSAQIGKKLYHQWLDNSFSGERAQKFITIQEDRTRRAIGFVTLRDLPDQISTELSLVGIHPDHQGRGIGRCLVNAALKSTQTSAKENAVLITQIENRAALRLYNACGFHHDSIITDFHLTLPS